MGTIVVGTVGHEGSRLTLVQFSESFAGLLQPEADGGLALAAAVPVVEGVIRPGPHLSPEVRRAISQLWRDRPRPATPVAAPTSSRGRRDHRGRGTTTTSTSSPPRFLTVPLPQAG
jgi:hypothetical protein